MITVDLKSRKPIYEQICDSIKQLVLTGALKPDDRLPAVRKLAVDLAINPNTIQKAYMMLEAQSIVYSIPGKGSFVSSEAENLTNVRRAEILNQLKTLVRESRHLGIAENEISSLTAQVFAENDDTVQQTI